MLGLNSDFFAECTPSASGLLLVTHHAPKRRSRTDFAKSDSTKKPTRKSLIVLMFFREMWQAKAVEIGCALLPTDCPLVAHVIQSY